MGTTAETKCPALFRDPRIIVELQKIRLFNQLISEKYPPDIRKEKLTAYVTSARERMKAIASLEPSVTRRESYIRAIENQFDEMTVDITLGHYIGVFEGVRMVRRDKKLVPEATMRLSPVQAIIADIFGDKVSVAAFIKSLKDLGFSQEEYATLAADIHRYRSAASDAERIEIRKRLQLDGTSARFLINPDTSLDHDPQLLPGQDYTPVFEALESQTIRGEIRQLTDVLTNPTNRTGTKIAELAQNLVRSITLKGSTSGEITQLEVVSKP